MTGAPDLEPAALEAAWLAHDNACPGEHWKKRERMAVAIRAYLSARSAPEAGKAVAQLGGAPDDLHNLIKVVFADMTIDRMNEICKEVIARRNPALTSPSGWQDPDDCELEGN